MTDEPNVPAIAKLIRETFPELEQRAFAIMEATLTKENMPNLPLCFVALLGLEAKNQSNNVRTPVDLCESIIIEFWQKPVMYSKADGGSSPFYAYQDYERVMNRLFKALDGYFTPKRKPVRFVSMATTSDEFALMVSFKVSIEWRWCNDDPVPLNAIKIKSSFSPNVPQLPFGRLYEPPIGDCK